MVLPRMAALAELLWMRPEARDYADFMARLPRLVEVYRLYGWTYRARSLNPDDEKDKARN